MSCCHGRNITDNGIRHMQLHTLECIYSRITDEGIKNMDLKSLYTNKSYRITDNGVNHMPNVKIRFLSEEGEWIMRDYQDVNSDLDESCLDNLLDNVNDEYEPTFHDWD
jgi:hypothetical protein